MKLKPQSLSPATVEPRSYMKHILILHPSTRNPYGLNSRVFSTASGSMGVVSRDFCPCVESIYKVPMGADRHGAANLN